MLHVHRQPLRPDEVERLTRALNTDDGGPDAVDAALKVLRAYVHDACAAGTHESTRFVLASDDDLYEGLEQLRDTFLATSSRRSRASDERGRPDNTGGAPLTDL